MSGQKLKYILAAIAAVLIIWFISDSFSQPGVNDLNGDFKEVAFYRNENNTGPIIRVYAVTVNDTLWQEMEQYGNFMPHTKYGNTQVYFFSDKNPAPKQVNGTAPYFEESFKTLCLARYEKDSMGKISFLKKPY
ncbi:hypothetical protein [Pontibacter arcticus]|uniref:Uncharacterized protein n=1 Tax=Pontibacter arcticus TaxID=2080288 RepID=A0A364RHD2_9BACT|nr:hypothetical protein [Pontibacter arcticus]RAU83674.1 hypothetical protein DP923_00955 [Pontibacter arcticus]